MLKKKKAEKKSKAPPKVEAPKPEAVPASVIPPPLKPVTQIETIRGVRDILPQEAGYWKWIYRTIDKIARDYGFSWIETPIIERATLFIRGVGKQTDIVEKELYRFADQGGEDVALRPEGTAPIVRAYLNHGMMSLPQPVKLYHWGSVFRYDRPQAGRYREFHQFDFDTLGEAKPVVDAELIIIVFNFMRELGLAVTIQINSIGTPASREVYKTQLVNYYRPHRSQLCEDCKRRLVKNPLRLLDCKEEHCIPLRANAPQLIDSLDEESKNHFMKVLEYLDEAEVPYILNPYLVRGLDYYTRTVFEIWIEGDEERSQNALGGGGRYDGLMELIGGRPTPGAGFAVGIERIILMLKAHNIEPPIEDRPVMFLAQLGEQSKRRAMVLFEECRRAGFRISQAFAKDALRAQMEIANKLGVRFTLLIGQKEVLDGTIIIRDMESGVQEIVDQKKLVIELKKKLAALGPDAELPLVGGLPPKLEKEGEVVEKEEEEEPILIEKEPLDGKTEV